MKRLLALCLLLLTGCMPAIHPLGEKTQAASLTDSALITEDGVRLPLRHWLPKTDTKAVLVALHGFNDYSRFFTKPAEYLSQSGIACFAYDQRGFGLAPNRGLWAGHETYIDDLQTLVKLLKQRYANVPVYLLGESMGGAVIISAITHPAMPKINGVILSAPALWARDTMPWYQTSLLWIMSHSVPWMTLTGRGVVKVTPSDNIEMLKGLGRDPWVIKATRVEAIHGLTDLMDIAYQQAPALRQPTLVLYGEKDDIIPKEPTYQFLQQLQTHDHARQTIAIYPNGHHLLLRDLHAETTWQDIVAWIDQSSELPSGADHHADTLLSKFKAEQTIN